MAMAHFMQHKSKTERAHENHCTFITLVLCIFSTAFVSSQNYCDDVKAAQQMVNAEQNRFRDFFNAIIISYS